MMKPKFTPAQTRKYVDSRVKTIERVLIGKIIYLAEQAVNICREKHTYMDQTGNLTSSIGYELFVNGKSFRTNFKASAMGSESGETGIFKGQSLANEIGPLGNITLVMVAGMEYAEEVEARGKEVLNPGYLFLLKEMPKVIKQTLNELNAA